MATLYTSTPVMSTTTIRWEGLQVQGAAPSELSVHQLPVVKSLLKGNSLRKSRRPPAGIYTTDRPSSLRIAHPCSYRQFVARRAVAADDGISPSVVSRNDQQPLATVEETQMRTPSLERLERIQHMEQANDPLGITEVNSLPFGPAGGRQQEPETQVSEAETEEKGITVEDGHLMSVPAKSVTDIDGKPMHGWSESSCDDGSTLYSNSPAAVANVRNNTSTSDEIAESVLIDRLLESLPIYDQGRSAEHYRIRALIYAKIGEYFSKVEGKARRYGIVENNEKSGMDVRMLAAMQQLADLILAEEGRSAADYNCRAQFFQNSAEIFCFKDGKGGESSAAGRKESGKQRMERVLQQLEALMLRDRGRSAADYYRRANVFGKTADALSARRSGAATDNLEGIRNF